MATKKKPVGNTPGRMFRLSAGVMADLRRIAEYLTHRSGVSHSRADAIRALVKDRMDTLRVEELQ